MTPGRKCLSPPACAVQIYELLPSLMRLQMRVAMTAPNMHNSPRYSLRVIGRVPASVDAPLWRSSLALRSAVCWSGQLESSGGLVGNFAKRPLRNSFFLPALTSHS